MSNASSRSIRFRRFWKPALATGAGGTGLVIWFEEIAVFAADLLGLILLVLLGGVVCLFDHIFFKSRTLRREDK